MKKFTVFVRGGDWEMGGRSGGKLNVRTKWAGVPNFGHSMIT